GTHHVETYARGEGSHAHRHPPGCNRADDSSLAAFLKTAKQDKSEDTRGGIFGNIFRRCRSWTELELFVDRRFYKDVGPHGPYRLGALVVNRRFRKKVEIAKRTQFYLQAIPVQ
ncbi:MAG TPA: hypothetical protein VK811_06275, partial [Candidatus Acidoferrum sp.]|nr:hypothetical protein [Candidatus Acidoferrum sp.]